MSSELLVDIASTFVCDAIVRSVRDDMASAGLSCELRLIRFTQMGEYLLATAHDTQSVHGTIVLLRLEDWLRERLESETYSQAQDAGIRSEFRVRVEEFVSQISILARLGRPVLVFAFASNGWIAERHELVGLCRTYTNLVLARVRDLPQVKVVNWPASLPIAEALDRDADSRAQEPFSQNASHQLGSMLGDQIVQQLAGRDIAGTASTASGASELANYLSGLQVRIELIAADRNHREQVDHIVRTVASFNLTGENPHISDADIDTLLASGTGLLVDVADRVSEHGASGIVVFHVNGDALVVNGFALSCPVLGKQVEFAILSALSRIATQRHLAKIVFEFRPSARNQPILSFLKSITDAEADGHYALPIDHVESRIKKAAAAPDAWSLKITGLA